MPSLHQIKSDMNYTGKDGYNPVDKKSPLVTIVQIMTVVAIGLGWYAYSIRPKIYNIPTEIMTAQNSDKFLNLFATNSKKIIWFGADCPISAQRKSIIDSVMKFAKLDGFYEHRPFLQNSLRIHCQNCLDSYIMENCNDGICIIIPARHQIIKTDEKRLIKNLQKYANY